MQRRTASLLIDPNGIRALKDKMLNWSSRFGISLFLDSNSYADKYGKYECLVGAGALHTLTVEDHTAFDSLYAFHQQHKDWLFGHLCYDLKNVLQPHLSSSHAAKHGFPLLSVFRTGDSQLHTQGQQHLYVESATEDPESVIAAIYDTALVTESSLPQIKLVSALSKEEYTRRVATLRNHIYEGDCYEITFATSLQQKMLYWIP